MSLDDYEVGPSGYSWAEAWQWDDYNTPDDYERTARYGELCDVLADLAPPLGPLRPGRHKRRRHHRGRITPPVSARRWPPISPHHEHWDLLFRRSRSAQQVRQIRRSHRRMVRIYGDFARPVEQAIETAYVSLSALWDEENDEGDDGHCHGPRPSWDFDSCEPMAVQAIKELEVVLATAMANVAATLSRSERRALLHGLVVPVSHGITSRLVPADSLVPPGQIIASSPHLTNAPPLQFAAPFSVGELVTAA
jgi:hypothetical protein